MKMKIKIKTSIPECMPEILKVGDWIDLCTSQEYSIKGPYAKPLSRQKKTEDTTERYRDVIFKSEILDLGVAMELPKGFEAIVVPRSSTQKKWGIILANSQGVIDGSYCGDNDIWKYLAIATKDVTIPKGTPIAQFRIQLSQKATMWQKLKWLLSSKIELIKVDSLGNTNRGGIGEGSDKYRTKKI